MRERPDQFKADKEGRGELCARLRQWKSCIPPRVAETITVPKERLKTILETAEGPFNFVHIVVMAYGAADDKPMIILLAIASLIIGNILGSEPKKKPGNDKLIGRPLRHRNRLTATHPKL